MQRRHTKHVAVCAFRDATHRLATSRSTTSEYLVLEVIPPRNKPCTNAPQHVSKFQFNLPYLFPSHIDYNTRIPFAVPACTICKCRMRAEGGYLQISQAQFVAHSYHPGSPWWCLPAVLEHATRTATTTNNVYGNDPKDQKRF